MQIDQEIEQLKSELSELEDIHPDYIFPEIKELQTLVLACHAHLENALENRIRMEVVGLRTKDNFISVENWDKVSSKIQPLILSLSFMGKVKIIEDFKEVSPEFLKSLKKVNTHRIDFAHPKGSDLRIKYGLGSPKCKENTRDLLRCLKRSKDLMSDHFSRLSKLN